MEKEPISDIKEEQPEGSEELTDQYNALLKEEQELVRYFNDEILAKATKGELSSKEYGKEKDRINKEIGRIMEQRMKIFHQIKSKNE